MRVKRRSWSILPNFDTEFRVRGFTAVKHQREVGASYFDQIGQVCTGSTDLSAMEGSTEEEQF